MAIKNYDDIEKYLDNIFKAMLFAPKDLNNEKKEYLIKRNEIITILNFKLITIFFIIFR